ncbi:hypothetical protein SKAU_G00382390 [Synaphobranchus kaupii]|uniref:Cadherin domain-containing protein n=1 Tax=Synaphobranchus kaupii TaxID=118154 RepID=A0A9Q1IEU1_SYNKA|nr:hypothetical protein SKAU_G00382390 [Synaphobranchus kaupii]
MRTYILLVLWASVSYHGEALALYKRTTEATAQGKAGTRRDAAAPLRRSKRGWMWNHFFLQEEYMGTDHQYVGKLHSDMDKGDGSVKYVLTGEGAGTLFVIDEKSGDLHATKGLDREEKANYTLRAQAVNRHTGHPLEPWTDFIVKIHDINDNEPKFAKEVYTASVPEMSEVGRSVIQVTATDADDSLYGNSARLVYSILQGDPYFSVEPETGIIRTALGKMNRETRERYQVVIQAKDMAGQRGGLSGTTTVNITLSDVNDSPPRFPQSTYHFRVPESIEVGSPVGRVKAEDDDIGKNAEMEYSIFGEEGQGTFDIVTDKRTQEGIIIAKKPLDFERKRSYTLQVQAENTHLDPRFLSATSFRHTATVRIAVEDVDEPPLFERPSYVMEVKEDALARTPVGTVSAVDPDIQHSPIRFYFSLAPESSAKANFTVRDNRDNTAGILTRRGGFSRLQQSVPVVILGRRLPHAEQHEHADGARGRLRPATATWRRAAPRRSPSPPASAPPPWWPSSCASSSSSQEEGASNHLKEDVRDNVVSYNDEGGGEEDTQAFDIGTLRNPEVMDVNKQRRDIVPDSLCHPPVRRPAAPAGPRQRRRPGLHRPKGAGQRTANPTAPPYDSLATYAYEGTARVAESLSSLGSATSDGDQDYNYLSEWGPRFKKLSDLYGGADSDRDL